MSLLNEMLRDLNRKPSHQSDIFPLPMNQRDWIKITINVLCVSILIAMVGFCVARMLAWSKHTNRLVSTVAPIPSRAVANIKPKVDTANQTSIMPSPVLSEVVHEEKLNEALEAIQEGDDELALEQLTQLLHAFPASVDARESLVVLYLAHGNFVKANEILDEGLTLKPRNLHLNTIKARLLVEQGKYSDAMMLLGKFNPDIKTYPDYYAVLAAIFNAVGRTNEAGSLYQTLIRMDPSNGQYYLGLGIALEHKHSFQQAIEAYKHASESEETSPVVLSYAEERLKSLQG